MHTHTQTQMQLVLLFISLLSVSSMNTCSFPVESMLSLGLCRRDPIIDVADMRPWHSGTEAALL